MEARYVNVFTNFGGFNVVRYGAMAGAEWIDIIRGSDWLRARIRERVLGVLVNLKKVPFTDAGMQIIRSQVLAQLRAGIGRGFLSGDVEPTCTVPSANAVTDSDKNLRELSGVFFRARTAGAIHKLTVEGELTL